MLLKLYVDWLAYIIDVINHEPFITSANIYLDIEQVTKAQVAIPFESGLVHPERKSLDGTDAGVFWSLSENIVTMLTRNSRVAY